MPPDKIKLSPESVRTFLELGLEHTVNEQELASKKQKKSLLYSFAKMLCVSGSYLYRSRDTYFDIYRLNLYFGESSDSIKLSFASKGYIYFDENGVSLSYDSDSVCKLIKVLLPPYIGVSFYPGFTDKVLFEQYLELLKLSKGKIALNFNWNLKKEFVQTLSETFTDRTHILFCDMNVFEAIERLQFPTFDRLAVHSISNSGQVLRVLKCKAKELHLRCSNENFTIDDSDSVDLNNETIKKLDLNFGTTSYINVKKLVKQLHKCCLNLKHFRIDAYFYYQDEIPVNQVFDHAVAYLERMNDLKASLGNNLVSMSIDFCVSIYTNDERDNSWIKRICENSEFKHWKFEQHEKMVDGDGESFDEEVLEAIDLDEEDLVDFKYHDTLEMNSESAGCNLGMTVEVIAPM